MDTVREELSKTHRAADDAPFGAPRNVRAGVVAETVRLRRTVCGVHAGQGCVGVLAAVCIEAVGPRFEHDQLPHLPSRCCRVIVFLSNHRSSTGGACRKWPFCQVFLCLSRACLGKYSVFTMKRRRKSGRFSLPVPSSSQRIDRHVVGRNVLAGFPWPIKDGQISTPSIPCVSLVLGSCSKRRLFYQRFLCSSRACLGKMISFIVF
jgi:hypothetical protein